MNSFDIDGVIDFEGKEGIYPGKYDVIITGRSWQELKETMKMLRHRNPPIENEVYYNPARFEEKTREGSAIHKANTILALNTIAGHYGNKIAFHFEDDDVQADIIEEMVPDITVIRVHSDIVELENKKRDA